MLLPRSLKGLVSPSSILSHYRCCLCWKGADISSTLVNFRGCHIVLNHLLLHVICHIGPRSAYPAVEARPKVPKFQHYDARPSFYTVSFTCKKVCP